MKSPRAILGVVLAGGRSLRFGSDKALAILEGKSLLDHALDGLRPHCAQMAVVGRAHPGAIHIADRPHAGGGPLVGLNGALHYARDHGFTGVLVTGCDMPSFPAALAASLVGDTAAVLARQHLAGYWPCVLADRLDQHLAHSEDRSMHGWISAAQPRIIVLPDVVLPNINRPDDLARLKLSPGN